MVWHLTAALLAAVSISATAAPVSIELKGATVAEFTEVVVKGIARRDYILGPGVAGPGQAVTLSIKTIDSADVLSLAKSVLSRHGIDLDDTKSVVVVTKRAEGGSGGPDTVAAYLKPGVAVGSSVSGKSDEKEKVLRDVVIYQPKSRSVELLERVVKATGAIVAEGKGKTDVLVYSVEPQDAEKVVKLLDQVDRRGPSVTIRAVLVEMTQAESSGRSLSLALTTLTGKLGIAFAAGSKLGQSVTWKSGNLQAAISMIEGDSRFKFLSEPTLRVSDGEKARLVVGSEVPTRGAVTTDKNGLAVQGIEYRTAGLQITVEPRVMKETVSLKVGQVVSSFANTTTSSIDSPTLLKRESETTVTVQPGELVLLAGLDESRESESKSGLSFLPSWAWSKSEDKTRSQLVLMLEAIADRGEEPVSHAK